MQGMHSAAFEPVIEGIIRNKMSSKFTENVYRDIVDELGVILGDNLLRLFIQDGYIIIDYKDHLRNRRGYKVDINDFAK